MKEDKYIQFIRLYCKLFSMWGGNKTDCQDSILAQQADILL